MSMVWFCYGPGHTETTVDLALSMSGHADMFSSHCGYALTRGKANMQVCLSHACK